MPRRRRLLLITGLALPLSQLGHSLASLLRSGSPLPADARHAYFGLGLEVSATLLGAALLACLLAVAVARRLGGSPRPRRAWPLAWIFLGLAALQLEIYLVQEMLEGASSIDVAVRGLAGQLPVAALAALALHWLSARVGPAVCRLRRRPSLLLVRLAAVPDAWRPVPAPALAPRPRPRRRPARAPPAVSAFQPR